MASRKTPLDQNSSTTLDNTPHRLPVRTGQDQERPLIPFHQSSCHIVHWRKGLRERFIDTLGLFAFGAARDLETRGVVPLTQRAASLSIWPYEAAVSAPQLAH